MTVDKDVAVIEYLRNCPAMAENPLFFNFAQKENDNQLFATYADNTDIEKKYIDGSKDCTYTFTILIYKSIAYNPMIQGYSDENLEKYVDVKAIYEWIEEQNDNYIFPDFGADCVIDSIDMLTNKPVVNASKQGEDDMQPALAQYSLGIRIKYLDKSKVLWNS